MHFTPNALCFGHDLPAAGAPCRVEISSSGLTIQFPDLPLETIPFAALSMGAGGFDHDQLIVQWTHDGTDRTVYVKDPVFIRSFRESAPRDMSGVLEHTAQRVRQSHLTRRSLLVMTTVSVLALVITLWLGFDSLVGMAVDGIPVEWEKQIGASARQQVLAGQAVITDGAAAAAVHAITRRLEDQIPNSSYRFEVTLVKNDLVNAVALPGGAVVVFTGLLKEAESPEEIAGVLAHEMNHVLLRHGLHGVVKHLGILIVGRILLGNQEGLVGLAERLGVQLTQLTFSRRMESEADLAGLELLRRARISPSGMIRFFERLSEKDRQQVEMLSTHPMSAARAARLQSHAATGFDETVPIDLDWNAVKAAL